MTADQANIVQFANARSLRSQARRIVAVVLGVASLLAVRRTAS